MTKNKKAELVKFRYKAERLWFFVLGHPQEESDESERKEVHRDWKGPAPINGALPLPCHCNYVAGGPTRADNIMKCLCSKYKCTVLRCGPRAHPQETKLQLPQGHNSNTTKYTVAAKVHYNLKLRLAL